MAKINKLKEAQDLLPDRSELSMGTSGLLISAQQEVLDEEKQRVNNRQTAKELIAERRKLKRELDNKENYEGFSSYEEYKNAKSAEFEAKRTATAKIIEQQYEDKPQPVRVTVPGMVNVNKGTTMREANKLLTQLGINLNVQLTRTDTMNLLATLLTCNEQQLVALQNDSRVPVVIKTVIKRLLIDANVGNMEAIERIWDRIFGKSGMNIDMPQGTEILPGILPNQPVSREAYIIIRERMFGKE